MILLSMVWLKVPHSGSAARRRARSSLCASRNVDIMKKICTTSVLLVISITSVSRRFCELRVQLESQTNTKQTESFESKRIAVVNVEIV